MRHQACAAAPSCAVAAGKLCLLRSLVGFGASILLILAVTWRLLTGVWFLVAAAVLPCAAVAWRCSVRASPVPAVLKFFRKSPERLCLQGLLFFVPGRWVCVSKHGCRCLEAGFGWYGKSLRPVGFLVAVVGRGCRRRALRFEPSPGTPAGTDLPM